MVFIETLFKSIIKSIDGDFAIFVASHGIDIGLLYKKKNYQKGREYCDDTNF